MRSWRVWLLGCLALGACGDNIRPVGPPLAQADTLLLVAHPDDDMIFVQPELVDALASGSVTTVYATTADENGVDWKLFDAAKEAYGQGAAWDCGMIELAGKSVEHCRLRDRPISLVNLGLGDGGIPGDGKSLYHLVDGTIATIPLDASREGDATIDEVRAMFEELLATTAPLRLHTLDLAATHGRDHSSHLFVAAFALWAAAETGYANPIAWHRGYNVDQEGPNFAGAELASAHELLGRYEACANHCGPCGTACPDVIEAHETWLERQYAAERTVTAAGIAQVGALCLGASGSAGDCAGAAPIALDAAGALHLGGGCLTAADDGGAAVAACTGGAAQYWVLDADGHLWSGLPPVRGGDMSYDHVRCLTEHGTATCGATVHPAWTISGP